MEHSLTLVKSMQFGQEDCFLPSVVIQKRKPIIALGRLFGMFMSFISYWRDGGLTPLAISAMICRKGRAL